MKYTTSRIELKNANGIKNINLTMDSNTSDKKLINTAKIMLSRQFLHTFISATIHAASDVIGHGFSCTCGAKYLGTKQLRMHLAGMEVE